MFETRCNFVQVQNGHIYKYICNFFLDGEWQFNFVQNISGLRNSLLACYIQFTVRDESIYFIFFNELFINDIMLLNSTPKYTIYVNTYKYFL